MNIPEKIAACHHTWFRLAVRLQWALSILGISAVVASITVATFTEELGILGTRITAALAAVSLGLISFFQIPKKISDLWRGWRCLNAAILLYEAGKLDVEGLVNEYRLAEELLGTMEIDTSLFSKKDTAG